MNEDSLQPEQPPEIVDKDGLKSSLSLSIGALVAFMLGFLPFLSTCCIHLIVASFVAVYHFVSSNGVTIKTWHGIKIGFVSAMLGSVLLIFASDMIYYNQNGLDITPMKEEMIKAVEKSGQDEAVEMIESAVPDQLTPSLVVMIIGFQILMFAIGSLICGAIGGSLAASLFKKGPLAR